MSATHGYKDVRKTRGSLYSPSSICGPGIERRPSGLGESVLTAETSPASPIGCLSKGKTIMEKLDLKSSLLLISLHKA